MRIDVTKTYLPPLEEYVSLLEDIWECGHITNGGAFVRELEQGLSERFDTRYVAAVANGTLALQLGLDALGITEGEVITTPFTYVATVSSILWQRCRPVFADIDPQTLNMDPQRLERLITSRTRAILPVHVFGIPCAVDEIAAIAQDKQLPVIYDASHAFGVRYRGRSLLSYGDLSTCSFHATKLFHTAEGGCVATDDSTVFERIELVRRFGHNDDDHSRLGINAKLSELHAALGLVNLRHLPKLVEARRQLSDRYDARLAASLRAGLLQRPLIPAETTYNYAYYPILTASEGQARGILDTLARQDIFPRRYFYPSLNRLPYVLTSDACPVSDDVSRRILCLPLSHALTESEQDMICEGILEVVGR
ncbi:MAG: DegT/DnrJ/EryC1/StrS family aminotransferase [Coriobacteriales bacterium]|nr:DegT/DnrJ/EryC1/StrS family aminotransferase [Coriobacteriales bacterium]